MAYVLAPRRSKSRRMKKKVLLRDGEESLLKISTVATQWPAMPCLPFAAGLKTDSTRNATAQPNSELQAYLDTFPTEIKDNEKMILKKIDQAWQRKDMDEMFQLIKVSH